MMARLKLQKIYICVFLLTSIHAFSQSSLFVRNLPQQDRLVYVDSNGYYFNGSQRFYKTDTLGTPLWAKSYGIPNIPINVLHLNNGDFLLSFKIVGNAGFRMVRLDSQGAIIWQKEYLSLLSYSISNHSVVEDNQSNLFLARVVSDSVLEVLKVDSSGNLLFSKKIRPSESYISYSSKVLLLSRSNGNIVIFCDAYFLGGEYNNVIEVDNNLNSISNLTSFSNSHIESAIEKNNSIFLTGTVDVPSGTQILHMFMQLDSSLNIENAVFFLPPGILWFSITRKDEFLISYQSSIMLLDSLFQTEWIKDIDLSQSFYSIDYFHAYETPEKNVVYSFNNGSNSFFGKLDSLGNSACTFVDGSLAPFGYSIFNSLIDSALIDTTLYGAVNNTNYTSTVISIQSNVICSTSIEDESLNGNEISIYPNPFNKTIDLNIDDALINNSEKKQLFVYNAMGELVLTKNNLNSKMTIELNEAKSGIYFVRLVIGEKQLVQKIIKE